MKSKWTEKKIQTRGAAVAITDHSYYPLNGKWTCPEMGERYRESTQELCLASVQKYVLDDFIPVTQVRKEEKKKAAKKVECAEIRLIVNSGILTH